MSRTWRFRPHDETHISQLSGRLKISPLLAQVLLARGYASADAAAAFLNSRLMDLHDPELLPGMSTAADLVAAAVRDGRRITIYGDYDVDGMTATSLLLHCLELAGATVDYYIPQRLEEGYGLNCEAIRQLHAEDPNRLLITVDCGITSIGEVTLAKELGLEIIVTDHHQLADGIPPAASVVHPRLPGSRYPFGELCGAGVAFKLAWAVCQRLGDGKKASPRMRQFLTEAIALAAIGTVADVVPLVDENRLLVRYGLGMLAEHSSPGLQALLKVAGLNGNGTLTAEDIGFAIAPRINAAGRLGQARLAVELLTTPNAERAAALADYLDQLNKNRQTVERRIVKQAKQLVDEQPAWRDAPALVLAHEDWHVGVIGIVASRVAEHFEKPTILIALPRDGGSGQGSGRSYAGVDLHAALGACAEHLISFGGHQQAAGLRVDRERIDTLRETLCRHVAEHHVPAADHAELKIDAEVRLADVNYRAVKELDRLGPFGAENPRPLFAASAVQLSGPPRRMGEGGRHLSVTVRQQDAALRAVAFGRGDWADELSAAAGPLSVCFAPMINNFRGRENVELQLRDWRAG